jgi:hypothetical protein
MRWAAALSGAGHEARIVVVDDRARSDEPYVAERITCRADDPAADLPFPVPRFSRAAEPATACTFQQLSDLQLAQYREQLRRRIDAQVDRFDPHVIHAQYIWVLGQLALETGVPYVLCAWGEELVDYHLDPRYRALADQAAANASRILAPDESILHDVCATFDVEPSQTSLAPTLLRPDDATGNDHTADVAESLTRLYQSLRDERFGGGC